MKEPKMVTYLGDRAEDNHDRTQVWEVYYRTGHKSVESAMDQRMDFPENCTNIIG